MRYNLQVVPDTFHPFLTISTTPHSSAFCNSALFGGLCQWHYCQWQYPFRGCVDVSGSRLMRQYTIWYDLNVQVLVTCIFNLPLCAKLKHPIALRTRSFGSHGHDQVPVTTCLRHAAETASRQSTACCTWSRLTRVKLSYRGNIACYVCKNRARIVMRWLLPYSLHDLQVKHSWVFL